MPWKEKSVVSIRKEFRCGARIDLGGTGPDEAAKDSLDVESVFRF
jgi:hypothetical protein